MDRFIFQLTNFGTKRGLKFAERQLKKYGLKNDLDYCWMPYNKDRHKLDLWAIYTTGSTLDSKTLMDLVRRRGKE